MRNLVNYRTILFLSLHQRLKLFWIKILFLTLIIRPAVFPQQWQFMDGPYFAEAHTLDIDPQNTNVIYVGAVERGGGLFKSTDGGLHWQYLLPSQSTYAIAVDSQNPLRIYASKSRSTDGGQTWEYMQNLGIWDSWALTVDPINSNIVYAGDMLDSGIWKSTDYGDTWEPKNNGIPVGVPHGWIRSIAINPKNSSTIFITTALDGLYKSYNGGEEWIYLGFGICGDVDIDWNDTTLVYLSAGGQILKSTNSGYNWFSTGINGGKITIDQVNSAIIYVVGNGVYKSTDSGGSWIDISNELNWRSKDVLEVAVDPQNNNFVYIGTRIGIYKSEDTTYQWQQHFKGLNKALTFDFSISGGLLYSAAGFGIFYYNEGQWLYKGLYSPLTIEANTEEPSILLASTDTEFAQRLLYRSTDGGIEGVQLSFDARCNTYCNSA